MRDGDVLPIEIMARREDWSGGVSIYMRQKTVGQGSMFAAPVTMVHREPGLALEPMMRIEIHTAQNLIDELWKCGLRPTEGTGSAGSLKATESHLADMRRIAFTFLDANNGAAKQMLDAEPKTVV